LSYIVRPGFSQKNCRASLYLTRSVPLEMKIVLAESQQEIEQARVLFEEYAAGLGLSLCFQNFDQELANLPGAYAPPTGRLLLAFIDDKLAGCVGLRKIGEGVCEMKRLFVRTEYRGLGLGRKLMKAIITEAQSIGYQQMRLDTLSAQMQTAIAMYRGVGFKEIEPYYNNPVAGATFMELVL